MQPFTTFSSTFQWIEFKVKSWSQNTKTTEAYLFSNKPVYMPVLEDKELWGVTTRGKCDQPQNNTFLYWDIDYYDWFILYYW